MFKAKNGVEVFLLLEMGDLVNTGLLIRTMTQYISKDYPHSIDEDNMFTDYEWSKEEATELINRVLTHLYAMETNGERVGFKLWLKNSKLFKGQSDVDGILYLLFRSTQVQ